MSSVALVVLLGPPGSGKGTQAKRLQKANPRWMQVSTGDLFRKEIASRSELGQSVSETLAQGQLVSDEITNRVFESQVKQLVLSQNPSLLVLDGYPRNGAQGERLKAFVRESRDQLSLDEPRILEFQIPESEVVRRLSGRLLNPRTGRIYHVEFSPPKKSGVCDDDGGPLTVRPDDQPNVIRSRFRLYSGLRDEIVESLGGSASLMSSVDGAQSEEKVYLELRASIQAAIVAS